MQTLPKFLKTRRNVAGLTQTELAKILGYDSGQFVSNIERGLANLPDFKVKLFAEATNTSLASVIREFVKQYKTDIYERVLQNEK